MADTPTSESKATAEEPRRGNEGSKRRRRRGGRKGKGKGEGEGGAKAEAQGERKREGKRDDGGRRERSKGGRGPRKKGRGDRDRNRRDRSDQPLTAGLFAGVADREMPCRVSGCEKTWTWYGSQQIRSLGKPPPKRMCPDCLAQFEGIGDRDMPCRNKWCDKTWVWTRGAQLYQRERQEKLKPPHRLCSDCFEEERGTEDTQVKCKIPECQLTWEWSRQAQLRHRAWVRRQQAKDMEEEAAEAKAKAEAEVAKAAAASAEASEAAAAVEASEPAAEQEAAAPVEASAEQEAAAPAEASAEQEAAAPVEASAEQEAAAPVEASAEPAAVESSEPVAEQQEAAAAEASEPADTKTEPERKGKKRRRRRRRKRKIHEGPPEKLCERCFERLGHLEPIEVPCKVHGCTSTWAWEREGQLRAWAVLDNREDVTELPQPPRRMCNGCFEFVRAHSDRAVKCGKPDCEKTWTYKTGAQLQDFLAGRTRDPIRLCEDCTRSQFVVRSDAGVQLPANAEIMPCQVSGCERTWVYHPGMKLSSSDPEASEPPLDRMCDPCRLERGAEPRDPRTQTAAPSADVSAEPPAAAQVEASGVEVEVESEAAPAEAEPEAAPAEAPAEGEAAPEAASDEQD